MQHFRTYLTVILLGLLVQQASATTRTAVNSAKWELGSTWSGGVVPACGDTIVIPAGITVEITSLLDFTLCAQTMVVSISGTLTFQTGKKLKLPCNSTLTINSGGTITASGGGGSSNLIDICNVTVWTAAQGTVTGPFVFQVTPLPVELAFLEAKPDDQGILISWVTLSEINNAYFSIEKSRDATTFREIGRVNGFGTSSQSHAYVFMDSEPVPGITYYRVRQTDFDGKLTYSKTIVAKWDGEMDFRIYPNPTYGDLFADIDGRYRKQVCKMTICSTAGNRVIAKDIFISNTGYGIKLLRENEFLKPGNYTVTMEFETGSLSRQIIVK